jgi:hypothetical protein
MEMIPYNSKNNQKQKKGVSFRERLESIAKSSLKQGQILSKEAFRRAKVVRSSAFEGMLLKATWPSNDPVQPEILNEIVKYSIPAFKFSSSNSDDDPYYMTMHKLWTKMYEKDWRTIAKSLHILHTIARDCQPDACERFSSALRDMVKTRNPKKPDQRYFDANCLTDLDDNSSEYEEYIQAYAKYVIYRMKSFTGKYAELSQLSKKTPEKKVIATLIKAQQCVTLVLDTADTLQKSQLSIITGYNTKLLVLDLIDLWSLLEEKMSLLLLSSDVTTTTTTNGSSNSKDVVKILRFYKDVYKKIDQFILNASKSYMKLRIKIPTKGEKSSSVAIDVITKRIAQLTSLHGGYVRRYATDEVARSLNDRESLSSSSNNNNNNDDEDDDEEDDDDDEDDENGDEENDEEDDNSKDGDDEEEDDADDGEDEDEIGSDKDDEDNVGKGFKPSKPTSKEPESVDPDEEDEGKDGKTDSRQDVDDDDDDEDEKDGDAEDDECEEEKDDDDDGDDDDADDEDDNEEEDVEKEEDDSNDDDDDEEEED